MRGVEFVKDHMWGLALKRRGSWSSLSSMSSSRHEDSTRAPSTRSLRSKRVSILSGRSSRKDKARPETVNV
eukprot:3333255-Prymnesium_polylepis.3